MPMERFSGPDGGTGGGTSVLAGPRPKIPALRDFARADRDRPRSASAGQQQMWILHQLEPASPAYLMTWAVRLYGPLDGEALRAAWERVVARHEVLRTRYAHTEGTLHQIVDPPARFEIQRVEAGRGPRAARLERARHIAEWERRRPFDLTSEHPLRVTLVAVDADVHVLVIHVHHIACDGPSFVRLSAEVAALYGEFAGGPPAGLAPVAVQYADYAAWEIAREQAGSLRPHLDYWRRELDGLAPLELPLDRPRSTRSDARGRSVEIGLAPEVLDAVRALARTRRATPFMVLLAAYQAVLADISDTDDVAVGLPVSGRLTPELDGTIGYLTNTVVVRSRPRADASFVELVDQVRGRFLDAFDHRAAPFARVMDEVSPVRAAHSNPLFQALFDLNPSEAAVFALPGLETELLRLSGPVAAKFDLTLHVEEASDSSLFAGLEYAAALIDDETARAWAAQYERFLAVAVQDPRARLAAVHEASRGVRPAGRTEAGRARTADLPVAAADVAAAADAGAVPDDVRETIRGVWCEALGEDQVGMRENFFDVGGDSLSAIAVAGRLKALGLDVSASDLFAHQTIEELAGFCARRAAACADTAANPTPLRPFALIGEADRQALPPGISDAYPLSAMQLGMLVELRSRPDLHTYQDSTSYLIRAEGKFDPASLQRAAQLVVDRHEVLRTSFDLTGYSVPLQLVHAEAAITVGVSRYGDLGPEGWASRVRQYAAAERLDLLDPRSAPLIRLHAHTARDTDDWWITITECHPILEGWSFHTMLMEILTAYRALRAGRVPIEPPAVPFRFVDHIAGEQAAVASDEHRAYWRSVVHGRSDVLLPSAWQSGPDSPRDRYQYTVSFRDLEADLRRLAADTRTSMKAVLLAAHLRVMSALAGSEDFYTGLVCDARPEMAGSERVLGMYLNTLPFAMPRGTHTWRELVTAVYEQLTAFWPHRGFPVQLIQQEFGRGGRLLEIFFNYLDFHQVDKTLMEMDETYNDNENEFALHVFTIAGLVKLNTTGHCVSRAAAERLGAAYRAVLEDMARGPEGDAAADLLPRNDAELTGIAGGRRRARLVSAAKTEPPPRWETLFGRPVGDPARPGPTQPDPTLRILDARLRPVLPGVVGELFVGGPGPAEGTLDAAPAERFVPDAYGEPGDRLLRTGLLARFTATGSVEYLGSAARRPDGLPDELYRTRELLDAHPAVDSSHVVRTPGTADGDGLLAYVRLLPEASRETFDSEDVRRWLAARRLPRHLIPDALVQVDAWPLTASGHVDPAALPAPSGPTREASDDDAEPWDEQFGELLRNALPPDVSLTPATPLTDSGLDSISMVGLLVALERAYQVVFPDDVVLPELFRTPRALWNGLRDILQRESR